MWIQLRIFSLCTSSDKKWCAWSGVQRTYDHIYVQHKNQLNGKVCNLIYIGMNFYLNFQFDFLSFSSIYRVTKRHYPWRCVRTVSTRTSWFSTFRLMNLPVCSTICCVERKNEEREGENKRKQMQKEWERVNCDKRSVIWPKPTWNSALE